MYRYLLTCALLIPIVSCGEQVVPSESRVENTQGPPATGTYFRPNREICQVHGPNFQYCNSPVPTIFRAGKVTSTRSTSIVRTFPFFNHINLTFHCKAGFPEEIGFSLHNRVGGISPSLMAAGIHVEDIPVPYEGAALKLVPRLDPTNFYPMDGECSFEVVSNYESIDLRAVDLFIAREKALLKPLQAIQEEVIGSIWESRITSVAKNSIGILKELEESTDSPAERIRIQDARNDLATLLADAEEKCENRSRRTRRSETCANLISQIKGTVGEAISLESTILSSVADFLRSEADRFDGIDRDMALAIKRSIASFGT